MMIHSMYQIGRSTLLSWKQNPKKHGRHTHTPRRVWTPNENESTSKMKGLRISAWNGTASRVIGTNHTAMLTMNPEQQTKTPRVEIVLMFRALLVAYSCLQAKKVSGGSFIIICTIWCRAIFVSSDCHSGIGTLGSFDHEMMPTSWTTQSWQMYLACRP